MVRESHPEAVGLRYGDPVFGGCMRASNNSQSMQVHGSEPRTSSSLSPGSEPDSAREDAARQLEPSASVDERRPAGALPGRTHSASGLRLKGSELSFEIDPGSTPHRQATLDRRNLAAMVNLTGGVAQGLESVLDALDRAHPGRFVTFTEPSWNAFTRSDFPSFQAEQIEKAHRLGAKGLKLTKTLGLYLRERVTEGPLVTVDDRRFDPMWETAGALGIPVAIHVSGRGNRGREDAAPVEMPGTGRRHDGGSPLASVVKEGTGTGGTENVSKAIAIRVAGGRYHENTGERAQDNVRLLVGEFLRS